MSSDPSVLVDQDDLADGADTKHARQNSKPNFAAAPPASLAADVVSSNGLTNLVQQALATGVSNRYYRLRRP
ncbi:MAG TPA: hypothetical protein VI454_16995 [Verrucomicrobiae bacterium]|jgi:hypothetical protein